MGYSEEAKAYRMYDKTEKSIIVARDVIFLEDDFQNEETNHLNNDIFTVNLNTPNTNIVDGVRNIQSETNAESADVLYKGECGNTQENAGDGAEAIPVIEGDDKAIIVNSSESDSSNGDNYSFVK